MGLDIMADLVILLEKINIKIMLTLLKRVKVNI